MDIEFTQLRYADSVPVAVRQTLSHAQTLYDSAAVTHAVDQLAVRFTVTWQNDDPLLITLLPEGFVFGGMLLQRLGFPCQHVAATADAAGAPQLSDRTRLAQRNVAVMMARLLPASVEALTSWAQQQGVANLLVLVLLAPAEPVVTVPPVTAWPALQADASGVFGSGLSVHGYGANLPGLYHVPGDPGVDLN